jgi:phosphoglycolate phosphatase-like HAD superfamily hydrolase
LAAQAASNLPNNEGKHVSHKHSDSKLILFDMDGTLVEIGHVHREAVFGAIRDVFGAELEEDIPPEVHQGNTQHNILRAVGRVLELDAEWVEAHLDQAIQRQVELSISILERDLQHVVLPGAMALLVALQEAGHALGLVTGTVSGVTNAVLDRTGLGRFFPVRVCGDEGPDRLSLLQLAVDRAVQAYGWVPEDGEVVVVGDTARDIKAAKQLGARVIAVASGMTPPDELQRYAPDALLVSFEDVSAAVRTIAGTHKST